MGFPPISEEFASFLLLGGAAVAGYAAVRGAADVLLPADDSAPVKRAVIHSAITAIISLAAIFHRPALLDIAVGVPFSATVAAITLGLGVVLFVVPPGGSTTPLPPNRIWSFLLPTGLLALLIGFSGQLTGQGALVLAVEGAAILTLYASSGTAQAQSGRARIFSRPYQGFSVVQGVFAIILAILAGWGMVKGASGLGMHNPAFRPGVAAVIALGPAVVLPMIPPVATLAERGRRHEAITAIVGFGLINLCAVLPLVVVAQQFAPMVTATTQPATAGGLLFPILVWRLDTVLVSTVGLLLLPVAIGRWTLSRIEGFALVAIYVMYLFLTLLVSRS